MKLSSLLSAALLLASNVVSTPTPTKPSSRIQRRAPPGFAYTQGTDFMVDGKKFFYAGTVAYWLTQLNTDDDIVATLKSIAAAGLKVVRIWGFREVVGQQPTNPKTYTALWNNGKQTINQAGLDRLAFITKQAGDLGIKVQISLTNNWAPDFPANSPRPAGYYSNSFGGMDTYVQQLHPGGTHDLFYTDENIKNQFKSWVGTIVTQFKDDPNLFSWEIANDPRCQGANGTTTSGSCQTTTITSWVNEIGGFIKQLDPNHLVASGDSGFYCVDCTKLFPLVKPPAPQVSGTSGGGSPLVSKRNKRRTGFLTSADVLSMRREARKEAAKKARMEASSVRRIRGAWSAPVAGVKSWARQDSSSTGTGAVFDGSQGVDSEDIGNAPNIDFTNFQYFPDQQSYKNGEDSSAPPANGIGGSNFDSTIADGINFIKLHAESSQAIGKPSALSAFGIVSQSSQGHFTPFDSTNTGVSSGDPVATDTQQQTGIASIGNAAVSAGITGVTHHQWGQHSLTSQTNTVVDDSNTSGDSSQQASTQGNSPDDGYSASAGVEGVLSIIASQQNGKDSS